MRAVRCSRLAGALLASVLLAIPAAWAGDVKECKQDARAESKDCKMLCSEVFRTEKDLCLDVDHECAEGCRANRNGCVDPILDLREACMEPCRTTVEAAKVGCKQQFAEGSVERDQCIDAAQMVAFACRDSCREGFRYELRQCRFDNRECIKACPPGVVE